MSPLLEVKGLSFAYPGKGRLLDDISFTLRAGEIVGLTGESGSGKTTLLNCLCGAIPRVYGGKVEGTILLKGEDISGMRLPELSTMIGMLFQNPETQLFSGAVEDDVVFGPENLRLPWAEMDERLKTALESAGMTEKRMADPKALSGGEAQLAALAATLALEPELLLFDEAMSRLDKRGAGLVMSCAKELKSKGKCIFMVEHEAELLDIADRVLTLSDGRLGGG